MMNTSQNSRIHHANMCIYVYGLQIVMECTFQDYMPTHHVEKSSFGLWLRV